MFSLEELFDLGQQFFVIFMNFFIDLGNGSRSLPLTKPNDFNPLQLLCKSELQIEIQ